ncbi:MAG TPA: hypothetical protein VJ476_05745, partial [Rhizomicrobium sp.]|nr:hypothetical protein [Rhizomicrobium sp.]
MRRMWMMGLAVALAVSGAAAQPAPAWMDQSLSADARADLVQAQMSQDDELLLVKGYFGADTHQPWIKTPPAEYLSQLPGTAGFVPGIPR